MREAMRAYFEAIVDRYKPDAVASAMDCSVTNVNYLRKGYSTTTNKKRTPRYVDFQVVEDLANAGMLLHPELLKESPPLVAVCRDIAVFIGALQLEHMAAEFSASLPEEKGRHRP